MNWEALTIPGAFILGCIVSAVATVRTTRYILDYLREEKRDE